MDRVVTAPHFGEQFLVSIMQEFRQGGNFLGVSPLNSFAKENISLSIWSWFCCQSQIDEMLQQYCFSMYGSVLWDLKKYTGSLSAKHGAREWDGVLTCHMTHIYFFLPVLSHTLPLFHEICKRFARFITKCMYGSSALVQSVVMHSIDPIGPTWDGFYFCHYQKYFHCV